MFLFAQYPRRLESHRLFRLVVGYRDSPVQILNTSAVVGRQECSHFEGAPYFPVEWRGDLSVLPPNRACCLVVTLLMQLGHLVLMDANLAGSCYYALDKTKLEVAPAYMR